MFEEGTALKKIHGADKVFDFSLGNPDLEPPEAFHRVFLRLAQEDQRGSHGYMANAGYPAVREAVAAKVSRQHQVSITGSDVVMSVGAAGALNAVLKAILNPGDEVLVSRPYFMEYRAYAANHGGTVREVDATADFDLDINAIEGALSERTAAVLINSPHNPTGRVYSQKTISALAEILNRYGERSGRYPYLIADEPYREIVYGGTTVPPVLCAYSESVVVNSWSKSLSLPGERIGFAAAGPAMREKDDFMAALIYTTRVLGYVNAPALMQRIVAELTDAAVDIRIYEGRRDAFKRILDEVGIRYAEPEGAFYLFCRVPGSEDDGAFVDHLKKHLILGVGGTGFGRSGWVRFAYCVKEDHIRAAGPAFKRAMEEWKP
jgi:aspartate aminotransferase